MTAAEKAVLTQTLALLAPPQIFGRISNCSDTAVWTSLKFSPEQKITFTCRPTQ